MTQDHYSGVHLYDDIVVTFYDLENNYPFQCHNLIINSILMFFSVSMVKVEFHIHFNNQSHTGIDSLSHGMNTHT